MNICADAQCRFCGETETAEHILSDCEAFTAQRLRTFAKDFVELTDYATLNTTDLCAISKQIQRKMKT